MYGESAWSSSAFTWPRVSRRMKSLRSSVYAVPGVPALLTPRTADCIPVVRADLCVPGTHGVAYVQL